MIEVAKAIGSANPPVKSRHRRYNAGGLRRADGLMIVVLGLLAGGVSGYFLAAKRGGSGKDKLHYAAVFGIALGLAGLFADMAVGWSFFS